MSTSVKKYRWYVILVVLWLLYVFNYFDRMAVLTFLPYIQKDLKLTPVEVGQLASAFFFAYAAAMVTAGFLTDKFGSKKIMAIAIGVFSTVTALTGFVQTFAQFIALRIFLGLGEGHHNVPASTTIKSWFPPSERGRAMGFFATTWAVAPAIAPIMFTFISAEWFGGEWKPIFFLFAIPGFIGMLALKYFITDSPTEMVKKGRLSEEECSYIIDNTPTDPLAQKTGKVSYSVFLKDVHYYVWILMLFAQLAVYWGSTAWLSTYLVKQHGMDLKQMGLFAAAPYVVAFFSMLLGGWLMDKVFYRMKPIALIAYLGCAPVLWLLGTVEKGNTGLLLTLLLLIGFFFNLNGGTIFAYMQNRYPKEVFGSALGLAQGIGQVGAALAPLIAGYLVKVGPNGSQDFSAAFAFFAALAVAAALAALILQENKNQPAEVGKSTVTTGKA